MDRVFIRMPNGHVRPTKSFTLFDKVRRGFAAMADGADATIVEVFHRSNHDVDVTVELNDHHPHG